MSTSSSVIQKSQSVHQPPSTSTLNLSQEQVILQQQLVILESILPEEIDTCISSLQSIKTNVSKLSKNNPQEQFNIILRDTIKRMHTVAVKLLEMDYIEICLTILNDCDILCQLYPLVQDLRIKVLNHISCCLRSRKEYAKALKLLDKASAISQQFNYQYNGTTLLNKSVLLNDLNKFQEGISYARMAVKDLSLEFDQALQSKQSQKQQANIITKKSQEEEDRFKSIVTELAISFHNLAQQQLHFKQIKISLQNFYSAYILLYEHFGDNHPLVQQFLNSFNSTYQEYERINSNGELTTKDSSSKESAGKESSWKDTIDKIEAKKRSSTFNTGETMDKNSIKTEGSLPQMDNSKYNTNNSISQRKESFSTSMLDGVTDERQQVRMMQTRLKTLGSNLDDQSRNLKKQQKQGYEQITKKGGWSNSQERAKQQELSLLQSKYTSGSSTQRIESYKSTYLNTSKTTNHKDTTRQNKQLRNPSNEGMNWLKKAMEHLKIDEWKNSSQIIRQVCHSREENTDSSKQMNLSTLQLHTSQSQPQLTHTSQSSLTQQQVQQQQQQHQQQQQSDSYFFNSSKFNTFFNKKINRLYDNAKLNDGGVSRPMSAQEMLKLPQTKQLKKFVNNSQFFIPDATIASTSQYMNSMDKEIKKKGCETSRKEANSKVDENLRRSMIEIGSRANYVDILGKKEGRARQSANVSADSGDKPLTAPNKKGQNSFMTSIDQKQQKEQIQKVKTTQLIKPRISSQHSARNSFHSIKTLNNPPEKQLSPTKQFQTQLSQPQLQPLQEKQQKQLQINGRGKSVGEEEVRIGTQKLNEDKQSDQFEDPTKIEGKFSQNLKAESTQEDQSKQGSKNMQSNSQQQQQDWSLICEVSDCVVRTITGGMKQGKLRCLFDYKTYLLSIVYQDKGQQTNCRVIVDCTQLRQSYSYQQQQEGGQPQPISKQSVIPGQQQQPNDKNDKSQLPLPPNNNQSKQQNEKDKNTNSNSINGSDNNIDNLDAPRKLLVSKSMESVFKSIKLVLLLDIEKKILSIPQNSLSTLILTIFTPLHPQGIPTKISLNKIQVNIKQRSQNYSQHSQTQQQQQQPPQQLQLQSSLSDFRRSYSVQGVEICKLSLEIPNEEAFILSNIQKLKQLNSKQFQILQNYEVFSISNINGILASYIDSQAKSLCFSFMSSSNQLDLTHFLFVQPIVDDYGEYLLSQNTRIALNLLAKSLKDLWIIDNNSLTYISNQWSLRNEMEVKNKGVKQFIYQLVQQSGTQVSIIEKQESWIQLYQQPTKEGLQQIEESQESEDESKFGSKHSFLLHANLDDMKSPSNSSIFRAVNKNESNTTPNINSKKKELLKDEKISQGIKGITNKNKVINTEQNENNNHNKICNTPNSAADHFNQNMLINEGSFYELDQMKNASKDAKGINQNSKNITNSQQLLKQRPQSKHPQIKQRTEPVEISLDDSLDKDGDIEYININEE